MTPSESREIFLDTILPQKDIDRLKKQGLYEQYVVGKISVDDIYRQLKDQGI